MQSASEVHQQGLLHAAYMAGFIDGEGTITFARGKTNSGGRILKPRLIVGQKKPEVLYAMMETFVTGHVFQQPGGLFVYQADSIKNMWVLEKVLPFLIIKKRQAEIILDFCKCRTENKGRPTDQHCWDLDVEMRALNLRGRHPDKQGV